MKIRSVLVVVFVLVCCIWLIDGRPAARTLGFRPNIRIADQISNVGTAPPADADCRRAANRPCYSPQEIQAAYGLTALLNAGYTGVGQTIIIVDSFGSPTLENDLRTFDAGYGLPDPPSLTILAPLGTVPFDAANPSHRAWAT